MSKGINDKHSTRIITDPDFIAEQAASTVLESAIRDTDGPDDDDDIRWLREQRLHHRSLAWIHKPTVAKLCFVLLLWFVSMAVSISSKIILLLGVMCRHAEEKYGIDSCRDPKVQELTSNLQSKIMFVTGLTATLVSGKVGELSDRVGRKKVLLFMAAITFVGKATNIFLLWPGVTYHESWFIIQTIVENLGGGLVGLLGVANSYITDIVDPHDRIVSLGFSNGTMFAGIGLGPLLGSYILRRTGDDFSTLYVDAFLGALFFILVAVLIKESRSKQLRSRSQSMHMMRKASFASQRSMQISSDEMGFVERYIPLWRIYDIFAPLKLLWLPKHKTLGYIPRINILLLVFIEAMLMCTAAALVGPLVLYVTYNFNWNSEMISYFIALSGIFKSFALYIIAPLVQHGLRMVINHSTSALDRIDFITIVFGGLFELLSPGTIIGANSSIWIYVSTMFGALAAITIPTIQATIIKYMKENQIGEVFGAIGLIKNLIIMGGPSMFLAVYSHSVKTTPKLVFYVAFVIVAVAVSSTMFLRVHEPGITIGDDDVEETLIVGETGSLPTYGSEREESSV